jgi:hypothetical protein
MEDNQVWLCPPVSQLLGSLRQEDSLSTGISSQSGQHSKILSLKKVKEKRAS